MGDPFSIAGTAVGITSLGIQVCQELVKFYSDYRNYRKDIDSIVRKAEGLDGILRVLGNVKSNIKIENDEASKLLQDAFQACDDALRKLKQRVTECNTTSIPGSMKDRVLLAKNKLLWPFKKNTVVDMQNTLDGLQDNLSLAVQIMSVDVESRRFETVSATSNSLILKADQTHRWLNTNTQILHSIEDNVEDLSVQQQLQTSILASHVSSHERFDGKLDVLITGMNELIMTQQSTLFSPTASKTLTSLDAEPTTSLISRPTTVSNSVAGHDHLSDFVCRCPKRQRNASPGAYHFFGIIWTSYPAHLPGCSLHNPKQRAHIAGATFKIPVRQAVPFVEAVLTWGAVPFQYTVSVRNTVPYSAPTLSIIRKLSEYLSYGNNVRTSNLGKALNITLRSLSLLFREGRARPSDADIFGRNILHEAMYAVTRLRSFEILSSQQIDQINSFLREIFSYTVQQNEADYRGRLPLDVFLDAYVYGDKRNRRDSDYIIDIPAFSNLEWNWAMEKRWTSSSHKMYQEWALKTESAYRDPLHLSLLCKSKSLFIDNSRLISTFRESPSFVQDASLLLHAAADWPEGLRILLAKGHSTRTLHYSGTFGSSGYSALDCAIELQNLASIKLLLDSDIQPTTLTWFLAVAFLSTSDMCTRSKIISEIAHWLWKRTQFYPSSSFRSPFTREGYGSWYHEYEMDTEAADALYSAGFIDIDIQASDVNVSLGTPLWSQALRLRSSRPKRTLDLLHWFIDKGAQMDIAHPKYGTSPTHIIAERSVYIHLEHIFERSHTSRIGSVELERLERLLHLSLECTIPDRCVCFCAVSGCTSITAALKTTRKADYGLDEFRWSGRNFGLINIEAKRTVIQRMELGGFLQHVNTKRAAIRLLTFDQLELTHTCHNHGHSKYYCYPKDPLSPDEISDIHYSERNDIDLFQQLLADFDSAVFEQTGTLLEFIDGYWMKRMTQIMSEKCTARPNELDTVLREVGVALVPEQEPPQEETLLPLTYEKFVWHVEKIVKDAQDL